MGTNCDECREGGNILLYCGSCKMIVCKRCRNFHEEYLHAPKKVLSKAGK